MDRDRNKRFRSKDYKDGKSPAEAEQMRGLDEINFLSYISIPLVNRLGASTENAVGVVNVDTKLFATDKELESEVVGDKVYRTQLTRTQLTGFGNNLYDQIDPHIKYLEELTDIIVPVVELYLKCRQGAT